MADRGPDAPPASSAGALVRLGEERRLRDVLVTAAAQPFLASLEA
jgi:hypothetical protein